MAWWAVAVGLQPDYVADVLGGMVLTGIGVGLTLPTMMATASSSLPPTSFATGSGVVNMIRQTGLALGVAVLVAVLGTTTGHGLSELDAFRRGWWVVVAISLVGVVPALALLPRTGRIGDDRGVRPHDGSEDILVRTEPGPAVGVSRSAGPTMAARPARPRP